MSQKIRVQFTSYLKKYVGESEVLLDLDNPATVAQLLGKLEEKYGEKFTENFLNSKTIQDETGEASMYDAIFHELVIMLVNGQNLKQYCEKYPNPLDVQITENDEVSFIVHFGGG